MSFVCEKIKKHENIPVLLLFIVLIIIGFCVYDDYGIPVDDEMQRKHGIITYRWLNRTLFDRGVFINEATEDLENYKYKYYGVAIQLPLIFAEDVINVITHEPMQTGEIYHMRHLYTYCFFVLALFFLYRIIIDLFSSKVLGITGVLMVYTFGRVFAESLYNIKDVMFLSLFTISLWFAEKVITTGFSEKWCFLFAVSAAFSVSSRIIGALLPLFLLIMIIPDPLIHKKKKLTALILICMAYPIWLLITPASWSHPIQYSIECSSCFSDYTLWPGTFFFGGKQLKGNEVPFDYFFRWIFITVPLVYQFFVISGFALFFGEGLAKISSKKVEWLNSCRNRFLFLPGLTVIVTLLYTMIKHPAAYCAWRHVFFLYPCMIIFAVYCLNKIFHSRSKAVKTGSAILLCVSMAYNIILMAANHPTQFVSYNPIGQAVSHDYEADYWRMSLYPQIQWIADNNTEEVIVFDVTEDNKLSRRHYPFLTDKQKDLIRIPNNKENDNNRYLIYWEKAPLSADQVIEGYIEVHPIISYGTKISSVWQRIED